jgi:hypothetical protein
MSRAIGNVAAIKFSTGFYDALAAGRPFEEAFRFGCNAISLRGVPESLTPKLIINGHLNPGGELPDGEQETQESSWVLRLPVQGQNRSLQELISLLDFRADMILSSIEQEKEVTGEQADASVTAVPTRDMAMFKSGVERLDDVAQRFAELHERNKRALLEGSFVLSHEITRQIQHLLREKESRVSDLRMGRVAYSNKSAPQLREYADEYPGSFPTSLETTLRQADPEIWKVLEEATHPTE